MPKGTIREGAVRAASAGLRDLRRRGTDTYKIRVQYNFRGLLFRFGTYSLGELDLQAEDQ